MPEISVIIPVYGVEQYLQTCVDSVLSQTFTDFEIILVDDGSPDRCGQMCDEIAAKDSRVRVIHKKNGGLSDARNTGIEASQGHYLSFVDSDDRIAPDMLQTLHTLLKEHNADISACGLTDCYGNKQTLRCPAGELIVANAQKGISIILAGEKLSVNAVNKLYRRELFRNIRFPVGKTSEDAFIMVRLFGLAKKIVITTDPKYYYIHHENSITTSDFKESDLSVIEAYEQNYNYVKANYPSLAKQAEFRALWAYWYIIEKMIFSKNFINKNAYNRIVKFLRNNTARVLKNPYFTVPRKITAIALFCNCHFYTWMTVKTKGKRRKMMQQSEETSN